MDTTNPQHNETSWLLDNEKLIEKLESAYQGKSNEKESSTVLRCYGFKAGNMNFIIDEAIACEILDESNIHFVPMSASWLIGVSNIRGDVVPIIDLEKLINGDDSNAEYKNRKLAIIGKGENTIGIELDELPVLLEFDKRKKINDFSNQADRIQPFIQYAYEKDDDIWFCINFPPFIESISF